MGAEDVRWQWHEVAQRGRSATAAASVLTSVAPLAEVPGVKQGTQQQQQPQQQQQLEARPDEAEAKPEPEQQQQWGQAEAAALRGWLASAAEAAEAPASGLVKRAAEDGLPAAAQLGAPAPALPAQTRAWADAAAAGAERSWEAATADAPPQKQLRLAYGPPPPLSIPTAVRGRVMQDTRGVRQAALQVLEDAFTAAVGRGPRPGVGR